jgi:branched-chain amino acid transport system permease protein
LLATFGLTLMVEDLVVLIWGPDDLLGRRAPGLRGAVDFFGQAVPTYDIHLILLGPVVLAALWLLFRRTRWGVLVRAATQDRDMVASLGVNQKWLFTSVFALGVFLAALGGALQIPRDAVNHTMDLRIIVDVFVVVVIGGLGSIIGAFVAAVLVSELNAFGILIFPKISIILVFLVMAVVLIVRPWGLFGKPEAPARKTPGLTVQPWRPLSANERLAFVGALIVAAALPLLGSNYALIVGAEIAIFVIFAASLHFLMSVGGLASFGHAAYFGLGTYGVAFLAKFLGLPMIVCLLLGPLLGLLGAMLFGWFAVQLSGVYFAMLTLAFAQIVWSIAFQWVDVTGGDNGILGVWPAAMVATPARFYWLALFVTALSVILLRVLVFSPFGYALRATRDSGLRSEAIGLNSKRIQWTAFVIAGTFAGIAGALFAYLKGSVFPDNAGIALSVDSLVMVLLGGVETVPGAVIGAIVYKALSIWLVSYTELSKLVLGGVIVLIVVAFPKGIVGTFGSLVENGRLPFFKRAVPRASQVEGAE